MALTPTEEALVRQLIDEQAALLSLANNEATITSKLGATKVTIAGLPSASSLDDADLLLVRQGTTDKSITGAIAKAGIGADKQPLDATLTALAGLTTAADQAIYSTGPNAFAMTSFTAAGRALVDDASASAQRTTLGLGTAATFDVGTSANNVVQLNGSAQLPAVSGALLTNLPIQEIKPISATVGANALTISASSLTLDFRSATLGSGVITRVTGTPSNLVVSSGSTLGSTSGQLSKLMVIALNNGGTIELAVVNAAGGINLNESGVISTTAEGGAGAADSATVIYSTTARSSLPYRVIGYIESTQATAGTWATAPSLIQGAGGNSVVGQAIRAELNATGQAPMFACRAWFNLNGIGTIAIRASGNITSITDNGVGLYTANFAISMPDANYAVCGWSTNATGGSMIALAYSNGGTNLTANACKVGAGYGTTYADNDTVTYTFFR